MIEQQHQEQLREIVGENNFKGANALGLLDPGKNAQSLDAGVAVLPETIQQVSNVLSYCNEHSIPVVSQGGRTSLAGAANTAEGQLILMTTRLNKMIEVDVDAAVVKADAGVTLQAVQEAAAEYGLSPGINIPARGTATIGGMVGTNAGGLEAFRYGVMRNRVLGLEAVLPNGDVISDMKVVSKANEGYDIKQLFIGSEGTLGVVTKAVLKLEPADSIGETALVACPTTEDAVALLRAARAFFKSDLLFLEGMWSTYAKLGAKEADFKAFNQLAESDPVLYLVVETSAKAEPLEDFLAEMAEQEKIVDALIAKNEGERRMIWHIREDSFVIERNFPAGFPFDVSVPITHLADYANRVEKELAALDDSIVLIILGHLMDGNLHLSIKSLADVSHHQAAVKEIVNRNLMEFGGSFSAEHGIGTEKRGTRQKLLPQANLNLMQLLKDTIDPNGIMNPGKVL